MDKLLPAAASARASELLLLVPANAAIELTVETILDVVDIILAASPF
ncbi:hypothetical protein [Neisseria wadsworthii]|nr:hypothetical protein [Neisseria wadsworthii]